MAARHRARTSPATGYWKFNMHRLLQGLRTGNQRDLVGVVQELDPDAVNREDGKALSSDDAVCAHRIHDNLQR